MKNSIHWPAVRAAAHNIFWLLCIAAFFYFALFFCSIAEPGTTPLTP